MQGNSNFVDVLANDTGKPAGHQFNFDFPSNPSNRLSIDQDGTTSARVLITMPAPLTTDRNETGTYRVRSRPVGGSYGNWSNQATISWRQDGTGAASAFACVTSGAGQLVHLGNANDTQAEYWLRNGGNTRYDASGMIAYCQWNGVSGNCPPLNHASWTNMYTWRIGAAHNGGCISGGAIYTNVTRHDNYDGGPRLYPCDDGGHIHSKNYDLQNFTIEGFRFHGTWDAIRLGGTTPPIMKNITIKGCWTTCNRDDFIENDTYRDNTIVDDNLIGDVTTRDDCGCLVFLSMRGADSDHSSKTMIIRNNLVHMGQQKATGARPNAINGYICGATFKIKLGCPRVDCFNNVWLLDAASTISSTIRSPFDSILRTDTPGGSQNSGTAVATSSSGATKAGSAHTLGRHRPASRSSLAAARPQRMSGTAG